MKSVRLGKSGSGGNRSPPTREAWIEISMKIDWTALNGSPPTREAWIEIVCFRVVLPTERVASHPGGVD